MNLLMKWWMKEIRQPDGLGVIKITLAVVPKIIFAKMVGWHYVSSFFN